MRGRAGQGHVLTITLLGCGTSSGVPRIGNDWGQCDPAEPRNRRTRASVLVESPTTRLLVDTGPDMRAQLLAADVATVDAVLWTHDHADHCHGLDDLRQIAYNGRTPVPVLARSQVLNALAHRFAYAFEGRTYYAPIVTPEVLPEGSFTLGDIIVSTVDQPHGDIFSTGFRFEHDGRSFGYATDFHAMTDAMLALYDRLDLWIVDALRERPHPTHAHLGLTLDAIAATGARRAILTHMDSSMDYATLASALPSGVEPGHDGLRVVLD